MPRPLPSIADACNGTGGAVAALNAAAALAPPSPDGDSPFPAYAYAGDDAAASSQLLAALFEKDTFATVTWPLRQSAEDAIRRALWSVVAALCEALPPVPAGSAAHPPPDAFADAVVGPLVPLVASGLVAASFPPECHAQRSAAATALLPHAPRYHAGIPPATWEQLAARRRLPSVEL